MIATASGEDYGRTLRTLVDCDACDAIIAIFVPALLTQSRDVAAAIREVAEATPELTIASVFMVSGGAPPELTSRKVRVPMFAFPEAAARAMSLATRHARWRNRDAGSVPRFEGLRAVEAAALISRDLARHESWLPPDSVVKLFEYYGLPLIETRLAPDAEQAVSAAEELSWPVALKANAAGIVDKADAGGVRLGLEGADARPRRGG